MCIRDSLDIVVERNAYGRQIESSQNIVKYNFSDSDTIKLPTTLIRAPRIINIGNNIKVIGKYNNSPIAILEGHHLGLSFHPELDGLEIFHQFLFDKESQYYFRKIKDYHVA